MSAKKVVNCVKVLTSKGFNGEKASSKSTVHYYVKKKKINKKVKYNSNFIPETSLSFIMNHNLIFLKK